eukprot:jgi/Chlat1/2397/Chrsp17S02655
MRQQGLLLVAAALLLAGLAGAARNPFEEAIRANRHLLQSSDDITAGAKCSPFGESAPYFAAVSVQYTSGVTSFTYNVRELVSSDGTDVATAIALNCRSSAEQRAAIVTTPNLGAFGLYVGTCELGTDNSTITWSPNGRAANAGASNVIIWNAADFQGTDTDATFTVIVKGRATVGQSLVLFNTAQILTAPICGPVCTPQETVASAPPSDFVPPPAPTTNPDAPAGSPVAGPVQSPPSALDPTSYPEGTPVPAGSCGCCGADAQCAVKIVLPVTFYQNDWLAFSRLNRAVDFRGPHTMQDTHEVIFVNDDSANDAVVDSMNIVGPWNTTGTFPLSVPAGTSVSINVTYFGYGHDGIVNYRDGKHFGALEITSGGQTSTVGMGGIWQLSPEIAFLPYDKTNGYSEPTAFNITAALGLGTVLKYDSQQVEPVKGGPWNGYGSSQITSGEEVASDFWQLADSSKPARLTAAFQFRSCCTEQSNAVWINRETKYQETIWDTTRTIDGARVHNRFDNDSIATATFTPNGVFYFFMAYTNSDHTQATQDSRCLTADIALSCGKYIRCWPLRLRDGSLVKATYHCLHDYSAGNYDYNDNSWFLENVDPVA